MSPRSRRRRRRRRRSRAPPPPPPPPRQRGLSICVSVSVCAYDTVRWLRHCHSLLLSLRHMYAWERKKAGESVFEGSGCSTIMFVRACVHHRYTHARVAVTCVCAGRYVLVTPSNPRGRQTVDTERERQSARCMDYNEGEREPLPVLTICSSSRFSLLRRESVRVV
jgi:hypothetical protein